MPTLAMLCALALAGVAAAQNVVKIQVGGPASNPFVFTPNNVTASVGDMIMFTYSGAPGNHSITQSAFTDPCNPLQDGFDSGNILIPMGTTTDFPTWNLTITNTTVPIWFFCKQLIPQTHCDSGMVGAINAPTSGSNTFAAFQAAAESHVGISGQAVGFLVGEGASASANPAPLTGSGISGFGLPNPTATAPPVTSTPATTTASAAMNTKANWLVVILAAVFGIVLA
ncbi:hypothetical protein M0805_008141 [Coniferiporia weirii]|nr:hypothetical protein M0805_008141 [Coniferiporia weirii]